MAGLNGEFKSPQKAQPLGDQVSSIAFMETGSSLVTASTMHSMGTLDATISPPEGSRRMNGCPV